MREMLRATWANNDGELLMYHPSMSEWPEWPFMIGNIVPFGDTNKGGLLKALGNPGVRCVCMCVYLCALGRSLPFCRL
jgi:hypothetical protein